MNLSRRGLIVGLAASLVAAPAIVKSASLMPIRGVPLANQDAIIELLAKRIADAQMVMAAGLNKNFFGDGPWAEPCEPSTAMLTACRRSAEAIFKHREWSEVITL